jgi:hypothetical protein
MGAIAADVVRMTELICFLPVDIARRERVDANDASAEFREYVRRLKRLLFAFSTRSPIGYADGLNDVATVLYFVVPDHFFASSTRRFARATWISARR